MKGKIIVIEGTNGSNKELQMNLLEKKLNKEGQKCIRMGFPVYDSPTGKIVGGDYLGRKEISSSVFSEKEENIDPHIACLYYAADRKYNINKVIDYLNQGYHVILDRYTTSNLAHQGSKISDKDERFNMYQWIDKLEYWLLKLPKPDITIYLKGSANKIDRLEEAYIELSELYNWSRIDCFSNEIKKDEKQIHEEILKILKTNGINITN